MGKASQERGYTGLQKRGIKYRPCGLGMIGVHGRFYNCIYGNSNDYIYIYHHSKFILCTVFIRHYRPIIISVP